VEPEQTIQQRLAELLELACVQFELADKFAKNEITIIGPEESQNSLWLLSSNSIAMMALVKEFLFNACRAYRIVEHGKSTLQLEEKVRRPFLAAIKPIVEVRDINEHGSDVVRKGGNPVTRPQIHVHEGGRFAVDETSINSLDGKILMGPLDCNKIYNEVLEMKKIAGFQSQYNKIAD
jgi:hypothetical protein